MSSYMLEQCLPNRVLDQFRISGESIIYLPRMVVYMDSSRWEFGGDVFTTD